MCSHYVSDYGDYYQTTPPVTVVGSGASLSVGQIALGQQDVVLPPHLILRDILRDSAGLTHFPQQPQPQSQMLLHR